jgi:predicted HTH transcriptional regulator
MKIEEIIKQPEGRRLEFKETFPFSYKETHYERLRTITSDYERLDENEKKILLYLLDNKKISRKIAALLLKFKSTKTYEVLNAMVDKELLIRKGEGRSTYYIIKLEITMSDTLPKGWKWVKLGDVAEYHLSTIKQEKVNKLILENLERLDLGG